MIGFGQLPFGRHNHGCVESKYEPRFEESRPADGSVGVSIYEEVIAFVVYCFSSRLDLDTLYVEISEDGGSNYVDAYIDGAFVAPFDGSESKIIQIDGQRVKIYINKTSDWANEQEIRIRSTVEDGFGNEATKETPVMWD